MEKDMQAAVEAAKKVKLLILDVHGVMTDNRVFYTDSGDRLRAFAHQVIRYNCEKVFTKISVRSKAVSHRYASNICKDRKEALKLLEKLKKEDQE